MPDKTSPTHMRLSWSTLLVLGVVLFLLGAATAIGFQELNSRSVPTGWLELSKADKSIGVADDSLLKTSLPFPGAKLEGKARFIPVGDGQPAEKLGYLMHVAVPTLGSKSAPATAPPSPVPPGVIISGFADAVYEGVLSFTLKDADGFVIDRLNSPAEKLVAGKDNTLQGFATQPESDQEAARVHTIVVEMTITKCLSCEH